MSSVLLAQFWVISKSLLQVNQPAIVDLYIYMPTNQNVLLFRKQGSPLLEKDLESVQQLKDGSLLVKIADYESFMKTAQRAQLDQIAADPRSTTAQGAAKSVLKGLNVAPPTGVTEAPAEVSKKTKRCSIVPSCS